MTYIFLSLCAIMLVWMCVCLNSFYLNQLDSRFSVRDFFQPLPDFLSSSPSSSTSSSRHRHDERGVRRTTSVEEISFSPACAYLFPIPDFHVRERTSFPLSSHPLIRRLHPDFDESTGNDHNPQEMYKLQMQWSFSLFNYERMQALKELRQRYRNRQ